MFIDTDTKSPNYSSDRIDTSILVIHATAGTNSLSWLCYKNPIAARRVSAHYLIRKDGYIYRMVDEKYVAWHAGISNWNGKTNINRYSIGIELENLNTGKDPYPDAQVKACTWLGVDICNRHNIAPANVVAHYDISPGRKTDPAGYDMLYLKQCVALGRAVANNTDVIVPAKSYRVVVYPANIRTDKSLYAPIATHINDGTAIVNGVIQETGTLYYVHGTVVKGQTVRNNDNWIHFDNGWGFIHSSLVESIE
jgi:hypothetical protein